MEAEELQEVLSNIAGLMGDTDPEWFINELRKQARYGKKAAQNG